MAGANEERKGVGALKNFERALGHVRNSVRPLTLMSREEVGACVSPADRAKLNLQLAYGVSSLFYMFLKTQGVSPSNHPVKAELDRIRGYFGRLKQAGKPPEQRTLRVDTAASRRFIDNALSGDRVWQNARTTDSKESQEKRAAAGIGRSTVAGEPQNPRPPVARDEEGWLPAPSGKRKHPSAKGADGESVQTARGGGGGSAAIPVARSDKPETVTEAAETGEAAALPSAKKARAGGQKASRYRKW